MSTGQESRVLSQAAQCYCFKKKKNILRNKQSISYHAALCTCPGHSKTALKDPVQYTQVFSFNLIRPHLRMTLGESSAMVRTATQE